MSKEAMKLALEALEGADWYINQLELTLYSADDAGTHENRLKVQQAITVMRLEIDAQNMASKPAQQALDKMAENARKLGIQMQPAQQEPVAWVCYGAPGKRDIDFEEADINRLPIGTQLYTSPPAQRTWVGLTDEEQQAAYDAWQQKDDGWGSFYALIEAKLKEKNT